MVTTSDSVRVRRDDAPKTFTRVPSTQQVLINGASATTGWGWKEVALPRGSGLGNIWDQASGGARFTHRHCCEQHRRTWGAIPFTGWPLARPEFGWDLDWGSEGAALHVSRLGVVTGGPRSRWLVALCVPCLPASPVGPHGAGAQPLPWFGGPFPTWGPGR